MSIDRGLGHCGTARHGGECATDIKGSWSLNLTTSWDAVLDQCNTLCKSCARCSVISYSVKHRDCSWWSHCDLMRLKTNVAGFRTLRIRADQPSSPKRDARRNEDAECDGCAITASHLAEWEPQREQARKTYAPWEFDGRAFMRRQTVVLLDVGLPRELAACRAAFGGSKVVAALDVSDGTFARAATPTCSLADFGKPLSHPAPRQCRRNHATKVVLQSYWCGALAAGVQIASVRLSDELYVVTSEGQERDAQAYVKRLAVALEWASAQTTALNVTAVHVSALDGLAHQDDGTSRYATPFPIYYARFASAARQLRKHGVWLSAPSGNGDRLGSSWPASDPNLVGVGCYCRGSVHGQRGGHVALLMPLDEGECATSTCNAYAVGLAVRVMDVVQGCSAACALRMMRRTAMRVFDAATSQNYSVVDPSALYRLAHGVNES